MPKSTRLSTIAADINIGKESIVDFLNSRGYQIENKATANLTEEMVENVYKHFNKEKLNVDKQRKRFQEIKQQQPTPSSSSSPSVLSEGEIPIVSSPSISPSASIPPPVSKIETPVKQSSDIPDEILPEPKKKSKAIKIEVPTPTEETPPHTTPNIDQSDSSSIQTTPIKQPESEESSSLPKV